MTNGWPDAERPGVPMNPERSAPHWVRDANCETVTADWNADVQKWAPWPFCPPEAFADDNDYLGPYHTPAEVAALVAEARKEEREVCAAWHDEQARILREPMMHTLPAMPGPIICKDRARVHENSAAAIRARGAA